jgi:phosphonopyruvate decarboxylase
MSLVDKQVYSIPLLLMIGWRGEPGVKDEPQHISQGEVTLKMLDAMNIPYLVLDSEEEAAEKQVRQAVATIKESNAAFALVIRKGTFEKYSIKGKIVNDFTLSREEAIQQIVDQLSGEEVIVSTTGKTSRELFECREARKQNHHSDFLTVGSMGHASQIALGIALSKPNKKVICFDGDGAVLMHMGAMAIIGIMAPKNFIHIVINNGAHESVGGQPTVAFDIDIPAMAKACTYKSVQSVSTANDLDKALKSVGEGPALIEIKVRVGSRSDLGRPTIKPIDNKADFMKNLEA